MRKTMILAGSILLASFCGGHPVLAQAASSEAAQGSAPAGLMTLTIFLRHDQSQTLDAINERLRRQHFFESFPPKGVEVLSWYVMMGVGQVVTLRFPAERLREVNRAIEQTAWGGYRTEFYPTYDYRPTAAEERKGMPSEFR